MPKNPPENMPRVTPILFYRDVAAALESLAKSFGFEERMRIPAPDGSIAHAEMQIADGVIVLGPASDEQHSASPSDLPAVHQSLYVYVDGVDAHCERARSAGAEISTEPTEMFWGDRIYSARDGEGHHWSFAEHVKDVAPEELTPPGS